MTALTLKIIDHAGAEHSVQARAGDNLMHVLRDDVSTDVGICGGELSCGTCLVKLHDPWPGAAPVSEDEADLLDALGAQDGARLGCQLTLDDTVDGLAVTLLQEE
jgi:2Fe-2S ferredoxin